MFSEEDWAYLGGLTDGEAYLGVKVLKSSTYSTGFSVRPRFCIALGDKEKGISEFWRSAIGGSLLLNRSVGYRWEVTDRVQIEGLLTELNSRVRFPTTKGKSSFF